MKIAVVGAGFCGMAVTWNLCQLQDADVIVFDPTGIAKGTSSIAAGLLHPYVGAHAKLNWQAIEGMRATAKLIQVAEQALGKTVAIPQGMLRLAVTDSQVKDFSACADLHNDVHWHTEKECLKGVPQIIPYPGIFIDSAITIDCESYLQGLWQASARQGARLEQTAIRSLRELDHFDRIIITLGANTIDIPELKHLPIKPTKGQVLEFLWPNQLTTLPYPINSQAYLLMNPKQPRCIAGATYEKQFINEAPDEKIAKQDILPKVRTFFPKIDDLELISCRAGIRAGTPSRKPLIEQINEKSWVLTGMGSKGLLYHALFAEELVTRRILRGVR